MLKFNVAKMAIFMINIYLNTSYVKVQFKYVLNLVTLKSI